MPAGGSSQVFATWLPAPCDAYLILESCCNHSIPRPLTLHEECRQCSLISISSGETFLSCRILSPTDQPHICTFENKGMWLQSREIQISARRKCRVRWCNAIMISARSPSICTGRTITSRTWIKSTNLSYIWGVLTTWLYPVDKMEMQLYSLGHSLAIGNCTKNNVVSGYFPPLPHSNFGPGIAVLAPIS